MCLVKKKENLPALMIAWMYQYEDSQTTLERRPIKAANDSTDNIKTNRRATKLRTWNGKIKISMNIWSEKQSKSHTRRPGQDYEI